uniref:Fibronectin type-III domain-containing protein n=1 Tax=Caldilinea aerophila TaxID=133453 RepID=A0A7C1FVN6_9CHLR
MNDFEPAKSSLLQESATPRSKPTLRRTAQWLPLVGIWTTLGGLALFVLILLAQPALAAIELSYFYVISNPASVILQWGTRSEFNVQGFEIQCKRADEPDIAYHRIGFLSARGGPSTPAQYNFPVTQGMQPGIAYCFRLVELTTDGTPGEVQDRCGFGPGVTPTPGAPGVIPTLDPNAPPPIPTDTFGNPIVQPGSPLPQPVATDMYGNPIPPANVQQFDQFGNPIPQPFSPLPQPVPTDAFGNPIAPSGVQQFDEFGNPLPPLDPFGASPLATPTFTPDPFAPPTPLVITPPPGNPRNDASALDPSFSDPALAMAPGSLPGQEQALAESPPAYIIVTAAPTEPPVALAALTPLPTVTPTPSAFQLVNAVAPTTQNLMILLLCLTFAGASGIGILGLITSVMFMRARAAQRDFYDRYSPPRRRW